MPTIALRKNRRNELGAGILLASALLVFAPSLNGYFLSDDFTLLAWTQVRSPGDVAAFFDPNTEWFYRPGVKVIYWLGQSAFGLHAAPFHLLSLLLHGANGYLVYRLVATQVRGRLGWVAGLMAGLLFLLNPRHAETVSWIAAIGDLVGTFCILAALLLYLRYRESLKLHQLLASLALFTVGLFTRETAVIHPLLLLLSALTLGPSAAMIQRQSMRASGIDGSPLRFRTSILPLAAYLLPLLLYFSVLMLGRSGESALARGGLEFRRLNTDSIALGVMDYVHGLAPGGNLMAGLTLDTLRWAVWVELAIIALVAFALWRLRWRVALFGLGWVILTPLIFVFFNAPTDRYFYLPSIGYAMLAAALIVQIVRSAANLQWPLMVAKLSAAALAVAMLLSQSAGLIARESAWHKAGQVSGGVFHDVRRAEGDSLPSYTDFYFIDLPTFLDGVPIFQNAFPQALHLLYGDDSLSATIVTCEQLEAEHLEERAWITGPRFFRFKGDGVEKFASEKECRK